MLYGIRYRNQNSGVEVAITTPARKLLTLAKESELVKIATEMARCFGAKSVWVCRRWNSLELTFTISQNREAVMRLPPWPAAKAAATPPQ